MSRGLGDVYKRQPVICKNGDYEIVKDLELNQFQKDHIAANIRALEEERAIVDEIIAKA